VLDRASTFADSQIVEMLKTRFVPVAIDQAYQRRQKDTEGEFYRKIAGAGPRNNFESTTQGFYIATAGGTLLLYNNNRDPAKVRRLMASKLAEFSESPAAREDVAAVESQKIDSRFHAKPPEGGLVVRVHAKVLDGYRPTTDRWQRIFQTALARDNLWISKDEHQALARGELPMSLQRRIARYHLVDNTRGEPPMWKESDIRTIDLKLTAGRLQGTVQLRTDDGSRGFDAELFGIVDANSGRIVRMDVVALGEFWGEGRYTRGAPKGKFPLAVSFGLADGTDTADRVPPQASRGWVAGYLR
jgi:hypothetical protein